jgi:hypothetical protein
MDGRSRILPILPLVGLLFTIGVVTLSRFAEHVRRVEAAGLSGAGFSIGVGFVLLVLALTGRLKP